MGRVIRMSRSLLRDTVLSVEVKSCADGTFIVVPVYIDEPVEPGSTLVGVYTRLGLARELEALIREGLE